MADKTEFERRRALNEQTLDAVRRWWEADSDARAACGSFGEQVIRVVWENGIVTLARLEPTHVVKPGRHNLTGGRDGNRD